jgi:DNA-binding transcriptional LysR family regulator
LCLVPELRHLRVFLAVAEERNFTRAAEQLHLAQQAVSKSVAQLERELGVELLERTSREVRLTSAGEALLADAAGVLAAADAAFARARDHGRGVAGSLSVGLTAAVGPGVLDGALTALRRAAPALSIALREIRPREIVPMLADRRLDLVLARSTPREPGIDVIELPPTPAALVVPLGHRLAGADRVELAAIDGERLLTWSPPGSPYTDLLIERCRRAGARVTPVESAVTGGTGLVELAALDSVALVPAPSPPVAGTARIALDGDVTLPLLAVRAAGAMPAAAARLVEALRWGAGSGPLRRGGLAAQRAHELARPTAQVADQLAHLGEAGAQLRVADLDGHHRVLDLRQDRVRLADRLHRGLEEALDALRRHARRGGRERPPLQAVALGEAGVRALRPPVGDLDRAEQLLLEPVGGALVEQLVRPAQRGQRRADLVDRFCEVVEQSLPSLCGDVGHQSHPRRRNSASTPTSTNTMIPSTT